MALSRKFSFFLSPALNYNLLYPLHDWRKQRKVGLYTCIFVLLSLYFVLVGYELPLRKTRWPFAKAANVDLITGDHHQAPWQANNHLTTNVSGCAFCHLNCLRSSWHWLKFFIHRYNYHILKVLIMVESGGSRKSQIGTKLFWLDTFSLILIIYRSFVRNILDIYI